MKLKGSKKMEEISIHYEEEGALLILGRELFRMIVNFKKEYETIKFICIGTDRVIGDSYGPMVGNLIKKNIKNMNINEVYGDFRNNVNASNIEKIKEEIDKDKNSLIIVVDASLTRDEKDIGKIVIGIGSIKPGRGAGKDLPSMGDIYIKGIVNNTRCNLFLDLSFIKLGKIYEMAEVTFNSIYFAFKQVKQF